MTEGTESPAPDSAGTLPENELDQWARTLSYTSSAQVEVPPRLLDQVIGQDDAVEVARKAATRSAT